MIGLKAKQKRFSLYFLEENEIYTQDLSGFCIILDNENQKERKGKIHICSRSIIFEPDDPSLSIYKYFFRYMKDKPKSSEMEKSVNLQESKKKLFDPKANFEKIMFVTLRYVEIPTSGPPCPYILHENISYTISLIPSFDNVDPILKWIEILYDLSLKNEPGFDPDTEINKLIMMKENKKSFNMSLIESVSEKPLISKTLFAKRVMPLITIHGLFYLTNKNIYFQSIHSVSAKPVKKIAIEEIVKLYRRRFELKYVGIEVTIKNEKIERKSFFFAFNTVEEREEVYKAIYNSLSGEFISETTLEKITFQWQNKEITNYEYLLNLNEAAYRSFSDITQYPVFPWIIQDYDSKELDLNNIKIYRDLKKPIGALNQKRLQDFKARYNEMANPKFLYGTHYSTPGYVIGYLLRKCPHYMLKLQGGKFDKPDRLFYSIKKDWENVYNNPANVKELIPEFFGLDDSILVNKGKLNFGSRQNLKKVNDVKLPKWAKTAQDFLQINRKALESDYVSNNLHHWIDLIFGFKQRGPQACEAENVFHYMTYEGMVDLEKIEDLVEKKAIRVQINEFGQTPKQLFKIPHPPRMAIIGSGIIVKEISDKKNEKKSFEENKTVDTGSNINMGMDTQSIAKYINNKENFKYSLIAKVHKNQITNTHFLSDEKLLTVGNDGFIKVVDLQEKSILKSFKVCDFCLSSSQKLSDPDVFALGSWNNNLYIFNLNYGNKIDSIEAHHDAISSIHYMPNQNAIFTGSWDCTIKLWKLKNNYIDKSFDDVFFDHDNQITYLTANQDETLLAFGDVEGNIKVIDIQKQTIRYSLRMPGGQKNIKLIFSNNNIIAAGENVIKLYDTNGIDLSSYSIESMNGNLVDVDVNLNFIYSCTDKGNVSIFDMLLDKKVGFLFNDFHENSGDIPTEDMKFSSLNIHKQGKMGVVGSLNGSLNVIST